MSSRKIPFTTGEIYHLCNRSTEGIQIFTPSFARHFLRVLDESNMVGEGRRGSLRHPDRVSPVEPPLVEVYAIVLMPNHFHLLVRQLADGGIARWMHRSCLSFSRTFNLVKNRRGTLFMGRFQAVLAEEDRQLFHLFVYIHANPLDFTMPQWRDGKISDWVKASTFLKNYKWSSLGLYTGAINVAKEIKSLISVEFPAAFLAEWGGIEAGIHDWSARDFDEFRNSFLED